MKKTNAKFLLFFVLLSMLSITSTYAQSGEGSEGDGVEPPPFPISDAIPYVALLGVGFAYRVYSKSNVKEI